MDCCSFCGTRQKQLTWTCPSCTAKYCSFKCMNADKAEHREICDSSETSSKKTFTTKTFYNTSNPPPATVKEKAEKEKKGVGSALKGASFKTKVCKFFSSGECFQGDKCTFLHDGETPVCKHWLIGACQYGENCYNLHPEDQRLPGAGAREKTGSSSHSKGPKPCYFFNLGKCKFGEKCHYLHEVQEAVDSSSHQSSFQSYEDDEEEEEEEDDIYIEDEEEEEVEVCEHYLKGICSFGDKCWKEHPRDATVICDHFLKGLCTYGDTCWKLHVQPPTTTTTTKQNTKRVEVRKKEEVDDRPYCDHFQRGVCTFGDACWKKHEMLPLYKAQFAPTVEERVPSRAALGENFNTVRLNSARCTPCSDDDIFISDSEDEVIPQPVVKKVVPTKKVKKTPPPPENIYEVLGEESIGAVSSEQEDEEKEDEGAGNGDSFGSREDVSCNGFHEHEPEEEVSRENMSNSDKKRLKKAKKKEKEREENLKKIEKLKEEGNGHFKEFRYSAAVKSYTAAISLCGANNPTPAIFNNRAAAHMMLENYPQALRDAKKVTQFEPNNPKAHHRIVKCCLALGKLEEGKVSLEKIDPSMDPEFSSMSKQVEKAASLEEDACLARERKDYMVATLLLEEAQKISPHCPRLQSLHSLCLALQGKVREASRLISMIEAKSPTLQFAQGLCHYYRDDLDRALSCLTDCSREYPEASLWRERCVAMQSAVVGGARGLKAGSYSKAKAAYDKGLRVDTSNKIYMARLYFLRATLHESYDQFDEAIEDCGRCIELQPSHKQAWATRGQLRLAKEDWAGGVQDLEEAYSLQPSPQTFAQLEEARRKKSLASKRKQNHYQILGVDRRAPIELIKKAYRAKAKEFHPDKHAMAASEEKEKMESKMKEIAAAHSCLSDPDKREEYDRKLERMLRREEADIDDCDDCSDDDEDFDFDVENFFYFMFGMGRRTGGRTTFVFRH